MYRSRILFILGVLLIAGGLLVVVYTAQKPAQIPEEPTLVSNPGWETYTDDSLTFRYPPELGPTYISPVEWPPKAIVTDGILSCSSEATKEIRGNTYCVTMQSEGAAGSIYTDYVYAVQKENKYVSLSFTLRITQCANYDEPQKSECERERAAFSPDDLAVQILQTAEPK